MIFMITQKKVGKIGLLWRNNISKTNLSILLEQTIKWENYFYKERFYEIFKCKY